MRLETPQPFKEEHAELHAQTEEEVLHPAALLVGEYIKPRLI